METWIKATPEPTEEPAKKKRFLLCESESDFHCINSPLQWWSTHVGAHPQLSLLACSYLAIENYFFKGNEFGLLPLLNM